jgi:DNA-binding CsgD family transcriptional regulator
MAALAAESAAVRSLLDMLPIAVAWLSPDGQVVGANAHMRVRRRDDPYRVSGRRVRWQDAAAQTQFDRAVRTSLRTRASTATLIVSDCGCQFIAQVGVTRLDSWPLAQGDPWFVVQITPVSPTSRIPSVTALKRAYGLTLAEAELARALVSQKNLARAAEARGITVETARTYLKRVFFKTNTRRQPELVLLLMSM